MKRVNIKSSVPRVLMIGIMVIIVSMIMLMACEPVPDDEGHHRESPSTYKQYP